MSVFHDNGIYRHLRFAADNEHSWNQWFEIITWPGSLAVHGDMGSWMFNRVEDMFTLFRRPDGKINPSYWAEKLQASSKFGGPEVRFSIDAFKEEVLDSLDGYSLSESKKKAIKKAVKERVFIYDDEQDVRSELDRFQHGEFRFSDTWEIRGQEWSTHFIWCLHAIVWAIAQYDSAQKKEAA
jgi:hypothetical protein